MLHRLVLNQAVDAWYLVSVFIFDDQSGLVSTEDAVTVTYELESVYCSNELTCLRSG